MNDQIEIDPGDDSCRIVDSIIQSISTYNQTSAQDYILLLHFAPHFVSPFDFTSIVLDLAAKEKIPIPTNIPRVEVPFSLAAFINILQNPDSLIPIINERKDFIHELHLNMISVVLDKLFSMKTEERNLLLLEYCDISSYSSILKIITKIDGIESLEEYRIYRNSVLETAKEIIAFKLNTESLQCFIYISLFHSAVRFVRLVSDLRPEIHLDETLSWYAMINSPKSEIVENFLGMVQKSFLHLQESSKDSRVVYQSIFRELFREVLTAKEILIDDVRQNGFANLNLLILCT